MPQKVMELHARAVSMSPATAKSSHGKREEVDVKSLHFDVFIKILGCGSFGVVRECVCRGNGEHYAVKSIKKGSASSNEFLWTEVQMLSLAQKHECILKLMMTVEDSAYIHIVTEICKGTTLHEAIVNAAVRDCPGYDFSEKLAARIAWSVLSAVKHVHSRNVVHCDITLENIIVDMECEALRGLKLIDFGHAQIHKEGDPPLTEFGGNMMYMSPQVLSRRYDRARDMWATGAVICTVLCGWHPFDAYSRDEMISAIKNGVCDTDTVAWEHITDKGKDFVACLLEKDPKVRLSAPLALNHLWFEQTGCKTFAIG
jgi:serine/threonine protein kinase